MAGHPGEAASAERVRQASVAAGARDVTTDTFDVQRRDRGETGLEQHAPVERTFPAKALPYSPAGAVSDELVDRLSEASLVPGMRAADIWPA